MEFCNGVLMTERLLFLPMAARMAALFEIG